MAETEQHLVVCDAGPVIHLDELHSIELLAGFESVLIPPHVWSEVLRYRQQLQLASIPNARIERPTAPPTPKLEALCDAFALDAGEREALQLMESNSVEIFLTDDAAARLAGEALGLRVHGTIGILLRSIRKGYRTRTDIVSLLANLPRQSTLHIAPAFLQSVIEQLKTES